MEACTVQGGDRRRRIGASGLEDVAVARVGVTIFPLSVSSDGCSKGCWRHRDHWVDMVYPMVVGSKAGAVVLSVLQEWLGSWEIIFGLKVSPTRPAHYRKVVGISREIIPRQLGPWPQDGGTPDGVEAVFFSTFPTVPLTPSSVSLFCAHTAPWLPRTTHQCSPLAGSAASPLCWTFPCLIHRNAPVPHCFGAVCPLWHCSMAGSEELTLLEININRAKMMSLERSTLSVGP